MIPGLPVAPAAALAATSAPGAAIKTYANSVNSVQFDVTPEDVHSTSDGGSVALALTQAPQSANGVGVSWLVKLDATGKAQWQEELGCFGTPPGDYTDAVSVQQTVDGGYVVGGGSIGCGSGSICPPSSGIQCALVEKLGAAGKLSWAHVYAAGDGGSAITQIRQTPDGGYIAVGSATDASQNTGALLLKLDGQGAIQWQRQLGPGGSTQADFSAVQPTLDGGYVASGTFYTPTAGNPRTSVLAVKFDATGSVQWQRGFNDLDSSGAPSAAEFAKSIVQTTDGGYLIAGSWGDDTQPGQCCRGALLLKLQSDGSIQWQQAYSGNVYCFFNGFSERCTAIGAVIYSVQPAADGGYLLAGSGDLELNDSVPLVPWQAKVDAGGNLLWQHFYFQSASTGRPLSEYFASSTLASGGGVLALGWTENPTTLKGQLYAVTTDSSGLVGTCKDVHAATPLQAIDPGLASLPPALPIQSTIAPRANAPSTTLPTSITTRAEC